MGNNCCAKRSKDSLTNLAGKGVSTTFPDSEQAKINEMIAIYFKENRNANLVLLPLPKEHFKTFMSSITKTISIIKGFTSKIFVPVTICNSFINPDIELFILMRSVNSIDISGMEGLKNLTTEAGIEKMFQLLQFQFINREAS